MSKEKMSLIDRLWRDFGPEEELGQADSLRVSKYGIWVTLFGFGTFMLWALFAPLSEGVISFGSLVADGNRKAIQHLEGGIVAKVHVAEGDRVQKGQTLVTLDKTQAAARLNLLETRYLMTHAMLDRLQAERGHQDTVVWTEPAVQVSDRSKTNEVRSSQTNLFTARQQQLSGQIDILEEKVRQLTGQKAGLQAELKAKQEELSYINDELSRLERLAKRGTVDLPRVLAQKKAKTQAVGMIARLETEASGAGIAISETKLQILQLTRDRRQEIEEQTLEMTEKLLELQEELVAARDVYTRTVLKAPQGGKVIGLSVFTVGGVVPPGEPLMEIVPLDGLYIKGRIKPTDADNVHVSMPARVRLSGLKQRTTPELNGTVTDVSGDAKLDEATGEQYFEVTVKLTAEEFARVEGETLLPGMPVELMIEAGQRTAMEYFMDPILDILRRAMREG